MSNINVVILTGNITRDPEVNYAGQEADRAKFGLAVSQKWKDRHSGQDREKTCFVDCTAWKGLAGIVSQYCKKGTKVAIEGELEFDQWTAQDGQKRSKLTVKVKHLELLGGAPDNAPGHHGHYQASQPAAAAPAPAQQPVDLDAAPF